jgi:levanase
MVGTYEHRPTPADAVGFQTDAPTGILESPSFVLEEEAHFELLVGGGFHAWNPAWDPDNLPAASTTGSTTVNLERQVGPNDWEVIFSEAGRGDEAMHYIRWDATAYEGDTVRLRVYDNNTGGWGHVNVDNIRYYSAVPEPSSVILVGVGALALAGYAARRRKVAAAE